MCGSPHVLLSAHPCKVCWICCSHGICWKAPTSQFILLVLSASFCVFSFLLFSLRYCTVFFISSIGRGLSKGIVLSWRTWSKPWWAHVCNWSPHILLSVHPCNVCQICCSRGICWRPLDHETIEPVTWCIGGTCPMWNSTSSWPEYTEFFFFFMMEVGIKSVACYWHVLFYDVRKCLGMWYRHEKFKTSDTEFN